MDKAVVLSIYACLASNPSECRQFDQTYSAEDGITVKVCTRYAAIMAIPGWITEHPDWVLNKFWCWPLGAKDNL